MAGAWTSGRWGEGTQISRKLLRQAGLGRVVPLVLAGLVAAVVLAPVSAISWGGGSTGCANSGCTTPFAVPLPIPQALAPTSQDATTDYYTVTEKPANLSVIPGKTTPMWTYNGTWPGPMIKATSGRQVKLHVINNLSFATTTHLHGAHVAPSSDGGPVDLVAAGQSRDYVYPNNQSARTQWYHDHAKDNTGKNVYMGLAGMYLISDPQEQGLNLPSGAYDVPLVIQDRTFNSDGTLAYAPSSSDYRDGLMGDTLFVNGAAQPYFKVATHKYRFRILNGSNARYYKFSLSNGATMTQIGTEGGLLSKPYAQSSISLAPAERADVVVDFANVPVGTSVTLRNDSGWNGASDIMRFDVTNAISDTSTVPTSMRAFTPPSAAAVSVRRTFTIDQGRDGMWTFNGKMYDPARIDANVALGATEEWTFENKSGQAHPIHMHDINFQVVSGGSTSGPNSEWKETVNVPSWSSVTVRAQFPDFTGIYMFHCHILEHEDHMLMAQFKVG
jgi:spore coat protein A